MLTKGELAERFKLRMQKFVSDNPHANGKRPPYLKNALVDECWPDLAKAWQAGWDAAQGADFRTCACDPGTEETEDWCTCWPNPYR